MRSDDFRIHPFHNLNSMKLRLPGTFADLKLRHLMALNTEEDAVRRINAVTGIGISKLRSMPMPLIDEANRHLTALLFSDMAKHDKVIELKGERLGFIPDWEHFSAGEWIDMETYTKDFWKTAHKAMSVLYRPIDREFGDRYTIKPYTAQEDPDKFLDMPAPLVSGALLFFWTSEKRHLSGLRLSLVEAREKVGSLLPNGDGIPRSTHWPVRTSSRWTKSLSSVLGMFSHIWPFSKTSTSNESNSSKDSAHDHL